MAGFFSKKQYAAIADKELANVTVDMEYVIPVDMLPSGGYYITVMQGTNYVIGYFRVD